MNEIKTERLLLCGWKDEDIDAFISLSQHPQVGEFFPYSLTEAKARQMAIAMKKTFAAQGWGIFVIKLLGKDTFIGCVGLSHLELSLPFCPAVQIGWRISPAYWDRGYATESAKAVLEFAFHQLNLNEVVSYTTECNTKSRHIMEKIGMTHSAKDDFDHPDLPHTHPFKRQVVYKIAK